MSPTCRSYNRAAAIARAPVLTIVQDDMIFETDANCTWMHTLVNLFQKWPRLGAMGHRGWCGSRATAAPVLPPVLLPELPCCRAQCCRCRCRCCCRRPRPRRFLSDHLLLVVVREGSTGIDAMQVRLGVGKECLPGWQVS